MKVDFQRASELTNEYRISTQEIALTDGMPMARLVGQLRVLPEWERLRPTQAVVQREWSKMKERDKNQRRARRVRARTQRTL